MPLTPAKGAKKKADDLFSKLVRSHGYCMACGTTQNLQCAHIVSRRYSQTRTNLGNAVCLCAGCHMHFTEWPLEFARWVTDRIGADAYQDLKRQALQGGKVNWAAELERLKPLWDAVNR